MCTYECVSINGNIATGDILFVFVSPCTCREAFLSTITIICVAVNPDLIFMVLAQAQAAFLQKIYSRDPPVSPHTKLCKITKWRGGFLFLSVIDDRDKLVLLPAFSSLWISYITLHSNGRYTLGKIAIFHKLVSR